MIVILDSGILDLISTSAKSISIAKNSEIEQCTEWFYYLLSKGVFVTTSDICYYEVRRKFVHIKSESVQILDELREIIDFLPLTTEVVKKASELWAEVRWQNIPTADSKTLDADMMISALWVILSEESPGQSVFIATKNVRHMKIFAKEQALDWDSIKI